METYPFQTPPPLPLSIVLVDDDPDSAFLLRRDLLRAFPSAEIHHRPSRELLPFLSLIRPQLLVTAYRLHGLTGIELIASVRQTGARFPMALVSGMPNYRTRALAAGADLFLTYEDDQQIGTELRRLMEPSNFLASKVISGAHLPPPAYMS